MVDLAQAHQAAQEAQQAAVKLEGGEGSEEGSMERQVERDWAWRVAGQRYATCSLKAALYVARSWTWFAWDLPRSLHAQVAPPQRWVRPLEARHALHKEEAAQGGALEIKGGIANPLRKLKK